MCRVSENLGSRRGLSRPVQGVALRTFFYTFWKFYVLLHEKKLRRRSSITSWWQCNTETWLWSESLLVKQWHKIDWSSVGFHLVSTLRICEISFTWPKQLGVVVTLQASVRQDSSLCRKTSYCDDSCGFSQTLQGNFCIVPGLKGPELPSKSSSCQHHTNIDVLLSELWTMPENKPQRNYF
jgi:hypothetical protein